MVQPISNSSVQAFPDAEAIQSWLVTQLAERLELEPEDIDIQAPFETYDLNSAEALALLNRLETYLQRTLSPTLLWNYPNIEALAGRLAEDVNEPTV